MAFKEDNLLSDIGEDCFVVRQWSVQPVQGHKRAHTHESLCVASNRCRQTLVTSHVAAVRKTTLHEGHSSVLRSTIIQKRLWQKSLIRLVVIKSILLTSADSERLVVTPSANYHVNQHMPQRHDEAMTSRCSSRVGM